MIPPQPDADWRTDRPALRNGSLRIMGEEVVHARERGAQQTLSEALLSFTPVTGRLLEIGFGLGMANEKLADPSTVLDYRLVEGNVHLAADAMSRLSVHSQQPKVIYDLWENYVVDLPNASLDAIFFDPYVFDFQMGYSGATWKMRFAKALEDGHGHLERILRVGGCFAFLNFEPAAGAAWVYERLAGVWSLRLADPSYDPETWVLQKGN